MERGSWARARNSIPFFLVFSPTLQGADSIYFEVDSYSWSQPKAIRDFIDDFRGPLFEGNSAVTFNRAEAGVRKGSWGIGLQYRYGFQALASRDFIEIYHFLRNEGEFEVGREYELGLSGWQLEARGVRVTHHARWEESRSAVAVEIEVGVTRLTGDAFLSGELSGLGIATGSNQIQLNTIVDYQYSQDVLFDRAVQKPSGTGFTGDLTLGITLGSKFVGQIRFEDIGGFINWDSAPRTSAVARSDRGGERPGGGVNPLVTGFEDFRSVRQKLPFRFNAHLEWHIDSSRYGGLVIRSDPSGVNSGLRVGLKMNSDWRAEATVWPESKALGLAIRNPLFGLSVAADDNSPSRVRFSVVEASFRYQF